MDDGRRRKYDPDLFRREAKKVEADFKPPPVTPPNKMVDPADVELLPKSRAGDKSDFATIAPGEKPDHIGAEELKNLPQDNLSQLSVPKSFGRGGRLRDLQEQEEEEDDEFDTMGGPMGMGKSHMAEEDEEEMEEEGELDDDDEE